MSMLPTSKTPPVRDPSLARVLLYGASKIGKSTWASHAPGAVFLACEAGLNQLDVARANISSWDDLTQVYKELKSGLHTYTTVIVDTVDEMFRLAERNVLTKYRVDHLSDIPYGKGYQLAADKFHHAIIELAKLPYGLILISHSIEKEVETRTGKYTKTLPNLPDKARGRLVAFVDITLFAETIDMIDPETGSRTIRRVVHTQPNPDYEAGDRTGRIPETMELDYQAFAKAYAAAVKE